MDCPPTPRSVSGRWISYVIAVVVLAALGGHVLLTLVYLSPPNIAQEHLGEVARRYMKPLFAQNWHLFSPNPGISTRKLAVRCQTADAPEWSDWFDPIEDLVARHNANRFTGVGKLLYVYRAIGDELRNDVKKRIGKCLQRRAAADSTPAVPVTPELEPDLEIEENPELDSVPLAEIGNGVADCSPEALMGDIVATSQFALAARYADRVCLALAEENRTDVVAVQFKLLEFFPVKYADREAAHASGRLWDKVHETEFPVLSGE